MQTETLIVGAGVSGLAFAQALRTDDYLVVESADDVGGYCRTVRQGDFVWDYSGHFFHFRHPEIEADFVNRIGPSRVLRVNRCSKVYYKGRLVDFPFQRNIDQLDHDDFVACLNGLGSREAVEPTDFRQLLHARFGEGICEQFLVPYNEKVYATDLCRLDVHAMGDSSRTPTRTTSSPVSAAPARPPTTRRSCIPKVVPSSSSAPYSTTFRLGGLRSVSGSSESTYSGTSRIRLGGGLSTTRSSARCRCRSC